MQEVTIRQRGELGQWQRRTFWCLDDGGYVRERTAERLADDRQVCHYLSDRGVTLVAGPGKLAEVVRREARRAAAADRRARREGW